MIFRNTVFFAAAGLLVLSGHFADLPNRTAHFVQAAERVADGERTATPNLLRNGSFEGELLYWHGVDSDKQTLVRGGAAVGEYALRIDKGYVLSAPFAARRGEPVTVSFFVRGDKPDGSVAVAGGTPVWKLEQVWPPDWKQRENRDGQSVKIELSVELTAGHELVFLPLMPDGSHVLLER